MPLFPARDGQSLHVRILGRGQPVLMLHGLGMQGRDWLPFVLPYLRCYQFYMPDPVSYTHLTLPTSDLV